MANTATPLTDALQDAFPLEEAGAHFPSMNPNRATVWRWALHGVRGVKLSSWHLGNRRVTTPAAIEEFLRALNSDVPAATDKPAKARRGAAAAAKLHAANC